MGYPDCINESRARHRVRAGLLLIMLACLHLMGCTTSPAQGQAYKDSQSSGARGEGVAEILRDSGFRYLDSGNYEKAIRAFARALMDHPEDAESLYGLASAQLFLGHYEQASLRYEESVSIRESADTYNRWGVALTMTGQVNRATGMFSRALEMEPDNDNFLANRALANALYGRTREAVDDINRALNKSPGSHQHQKYRLLIYALANREGETEAFGLADESDRQKVFRLASDVKQIGDPEQAARYIGLSFL